MWCMAYVSMYRLSRCTHVVYGICIYVAPKYRGEGVLTFEKSNPAADAHAQVRHGIPVVTGVAALGQYNRLLELQASVEILNSSVVCVRTYHHK